MLIFLFHFRYVLIVEDILIVKRTQLFNLAYISFELNFDSINIDRKTDFMHKILIQILFQDIFAINATDGKQGYDKSL